MRQGTIITVAPTIEPLSLDDAKVQLRIELDDSDQDMHVGSLIRDARTKVENDLGFPIMRQTRQTHLKCFPCGAIWLGGGDAVAVSQVEYYDTAGVLQTLAPSAYVVDAVSRPASVCAAPGTAWPSTLHRPGGVQVTWQGGWTSAALVPSDLVRAMKLLIGHWDMNREAVVSGTIATELQLAYASLLEGHRMQFLA